MVSPFLKSKSKRMTQAERPTQALSANLNVQATLSLPQAHRSKTEVEQKQGSEHYFQLVL
jgi:hypothetical protein